MKKHILMTAALLAALSAAPAVFAGDRLDHDEVKQLRGAGKILPMAEIIDRARSIQPGQIVEVELESKRDGYVYEMKVLGDDGRVHKLYLDAADGSIIDRKEK